jgi:two-component system, NarL family, response regulator YdfI
VSAPTRSDLILRIPVVAYCPDAARLARLAALAGASAQIRLEQATPSLAALAEITGRVGRVVVIARLRETGEELAEVLAHCGGQPAVLFTPNAHSAALRALQAGASAVLETDASAEQLAAAVTGAFHGLLVLPAGALEASEPGALFERASPLTPREMEILSLLAAGDSNKTIAARLSLSVHTVKFHISSILSKLGASSRTEAVTLGLRLGIVLF